MALDLNYEGAFERLNLAGEMMIAAGLLFVLHVFHFHYQIEHPDNVVCHLCELFLLNTIFCNLQWSSLEEN